MESEKWGEKLRLGVVWGEMQDIKTHQDQSSEQLCPLGGVLLGGVGVW